MSYYDTPDELQDDKCDYCGEYTDNGTNFCNEDHKRAAYSGV